MLEEPDGPDCPAGFESLDFLMDTTVVIDDPYPYFRYLRDTHGPVWIEPVRGVAMVSGHEEAMAVYRDAETYSSCNAVTGPIPGLPEAPTGDDASELIEKHRCDMPLYGYIATWDAPEHHAYRSLLTRLFTPRRLRENEQFMWRIAAQELDRVLAQDDCEFISDFSSRFAMLVIADLLGVPESDLPRFRDWFDENRSGGDMTMPDFFEKTFSAYIEDRRRSPRADVLTHLAQCVFPDGSTPAISVLADEAAFLFAAGQETTARSLAFALQHIADDPDLEATLRARRDLIPGFVEEILRLESPIKDHFRMARRTTKLGGVEIPAGTSVMVMIGAANRDPAVFERPDELVLDRSNRHEHLAFAKGPHTCLGQQLARVEMRVALELIFDRTAAIEISEQHHGPAGSRTFRYEPTSFFRGLSDLHLTFVPTT